MIAHHPRVVPSDGLENPVFQAAGPAEHLIVSLSFLPGLTDEQMRLIYRWMRALASSEDRGDLAVSPFEAAEPFVHEHLFHARLGNLRDPRAAVLGLVEELTASGVQIKDSFYACWEWRPNGIMGPRRDPRAPVEVAEVSSASEYLERLWDPRSAPPASEVESDLKGGFMAMGELVLEHRGTPLYFPGTRIGYGIVPFGQVPPDQRTEQVRRALILALGEGWQTLFKAPGKGQLRPQPLRRDGAVDQIEKIVCGTRVGYLFSIEAIQLLTRPSPSTCRFREYELMEAVLDVVARLGLAPVVMWQRFGTPTMMDPIKQPDSIDLQIWEVGGDHVGHPGLENGWSAGQVGAVGLDVAG